MEGLTSPVQGNDYRVTRRFRLMSRLGLVEPLVRWQRGLERRARASAATPHTLGRGAPTAAPLTRAAD